MKKIILILHLIIKLVCLFFSLINSNRYFILLEQIQDDPLLITSINLEKSPMENELIFDISMCDEHEQVNKIESFFFDVFLFEIFVA